MSFNDSYEAGRVPMRMPPSADRADGRYCDPSAYHVFSHRREPGDWCQCGRTIWVPPKPDLLDRLLIWIWRRLTQ